MIVAALGWLATAFFGALPFIIAAYITPPAVLESFVPAGASYQSSLLNFQNPLHAFFERMSGYTTTGLTMSVHEPSVGHAFLWYRSQMQWIGGAGMIVLSLAILRQPHGTAGISLYESEARNEKLRHSIAGTARAIWKIYVGVTAAVAVYLAIATFLVQPGYGIENTIFDAINHAMTGQSTGGFSTLDDSIAGYGSYAMELVHIPDVVPIDANRPVCHVVQSEQELRYGRFARTGRADQRDCLARLDVERDLVEHRLPVLIGERHVVVHDLSVDVIQCDGVGGVLDANGYVHQPADTLARGPRVLVPIDNARQLGHRPGEPLGQQHEHDEVADGEVASEAAVVPKTHRNRDSHNTPPLRTAVWPRTASSRAGWSRRSRSPNSSRATR